MKTMKLIAASAAVCALAISAPAYAQQTQDNDVDNTDNGAVVVNDLLDVYLAAQDFSQDNDTLTVGDVNSNNSTVTAVQTLTAINTNQYLDEVVDLDGADGTPAPVGYNSGNNEVRGSSFAAFAGILNQAWNTGINSNAQAATNIAAQGTINFGDTGTGASAPGGAGGGGDD